MKSCWNNFIIFILILASQSGQAKLKSLQYLESDKESSLVHLSSSSIQFTNYKNFKLYRLGIKSDMSDLSDLVDYSYIEETSATVKILPEHVLQFVDFLTGEQRFKNNKTNKEFKLNYKYEIEAKQGGLKVHKCNQYNLSIKVNKVVPSGVVMAFACEKVGTKILLSISTLGTLEVNSSSLNELDGKGETWRVYDLGTIKAEASTVLDLGVSNSLHDFKVTISSKKFDDKKNKDENEISQFTQIGLTTLASNLSIGKSYNDSSLGFFIDYTSKPILFETRVNASFKQGFANSEPKSISASDLKFALERGVSLFSKDVFIIPRLLFVNSKYSQEISKMDISLISFGVGIGFEYLISRSEKVLFNYQVISIGSDVVTSANSMQIKYNFLAFKNFNFNVGYELQSLSGTSTNGNQTTAGHQALMLGLGLN